MRDIKCRYHGVETWCSKCTTSMYEPENEAPAIIPPILQVGAESTKDAIEWPKHYNKGKIQMTDYALDQQMGALCYQVFKYIVRYRWKGKPIEDLRKARWFLDRLIKEWEENRPQ